MTWWGRLFRRSTLERRLDAELRDHVERLAADYRHQGLDEAEAVRRARLEFGGLDQVKELCRDVRGTRWLEELARDVRYGMRDLRRHPGFASIATMTLALGVAATMAVFGLVEALLLRPLPVANARELVTLVRYQSGSASDHFSYPQVQLLSTRSDLFAALGGIGSDIVNVGPADALQPIGAAWVNGGYFEMLGLAPVAGRLLTVADDLPGAAPAAVITHRYWMRQFGGNLDAVGGDLLIEGRKVAIVGITPRGFSGATVGEPADITLAIGVRPQLQPERDGSLDASSRWLRVLARPAPGIAPSQLQAALDIAWPSILQSTLPSGINAEARARALKMTVSVQPGAQGTSRIRARFRAPLAVALALVALVLVIACVNVANLLLSRSASRAREIALRLAIGARRSRVIRQLLTEGAVLAITGTTIGVALGLAGSQRLVILLAGSVAGPDASVVSLDPALNWRVIAAGVSLLAATTLLFGLAPAYRATRMAPHAMSFTGERVATSHRRFASGLVVAQMALSLTVLTTAGLFARSLHELRIADRGFRTDNVLLVSFDPTRARLSPSDLREFNRGVLDAVQRLSGVRMATLAAITPLQGGGMSRPAIVSGVSTGEEDVYFNVIGPSYFDIMQTPVLAGRDFTAADDMAAPAVAVVNEAFVTRYLQRANPLGQRVAFTGVQDEMQIVGVVKNAVYETLRAAAPPTMYLSYLQQRGRPMTLVVDAPTGLLAAAARIRAEVQPRVPTQPLRMRTLADQTEASLIRERLLAQLTSLFATLALTLAAIGLYGLVSYSVTSRTREIGVRLALGARHTTIERAVVRDALRLVVLGSAFGFPVAWLVSRIISGLIFGVSPSDPLIMMAAVSALAAIGVLAAYRPARRAARIDPVLSLRTE